MWEVFIVGETMHVLGARAVWALSVPSDQLCCEL